MCSDLPIDAARHVRPMGRGGYVHLFHRTDSSLCVVRIRPPEERHRYLSSLLATRLMIKFGLPTPLPTDIRIHSSLITETSDLNFASTLDPRIEISTFPALLYAGDPAAVRVMDYVPRYCLDSLHNAQSFSYSLAFDKFCGYFGPPKAIFIRVLGEKRYRVEFLGRRGQTPGAREPHGVTSALDGIYGQTSVYRSVTGWNSFEPILGNLIESTPDLIRDLTRDLPLNLSVDCAKECDAFVSHLLVQRSRLQSSLSRVRREIPDLFPKWIPRVYISSSVMTHAESGSQRANGGLRTEVAS